MENFATEHMEQELPARYSSSSSLGLSSDGGMEVSRTISSLSAFSLPPGALSSQGSGMQLLLPTPRPPPLPGVPLRRSLADTSPDASPAHEGVPLLPARSRTRRLLHPDDAHGPRGLHFPVPASPRSPRPASGGPASSASSPARTASPASSAPSGAAAPRHANARDPRPPVQLAVDDQRWHIRTARLRGGSSFAEAENLSEANTSCADSATSCSTPCSCPLQEAPSFRVMPAIIAL
eukprot:TRINITY_DN101539_c0_g1_i1.p1 TRINITY_DN101539_c0_g1~~TRINITY_DN101539_c0_g1_i1.p1  ORF type:complete len:236 (+),score=24.99 TRINITY_DN101539_c0_g1_i1:113-820(+)